MLYLKEVKNMNYEITVQIFSGSFLEEIASFELVEKKLDYILSRMPVSKVIMGWSLNKTLYEKTASFLAKQNIDFYLWFPIFSETGALMEMGALIDFHGDHAHSRGEHWDEDFVFCCPNYENNIGKILGIFEHNFASIPFKGVFLDRIRYPSFANGQGFGHGLRSVFSCFCPECQQFYKKENFDIYLLKESLLKLPSSPLGITGYHGNGNYTFEDTIITDFFKLKSSIISKSLSKICQYFREKSLGIGFDTFSPFLSTFIGQDLVKLSGLCDFIKPMMYRVTNAPAGIPFELESMLRETGADVAKRRHFGNVMNLNLNKYPFDLSFSVKELKDLCISSACPVYAGIEINRKKNLADVHPDYIEETIKAYSETGIRGFALSWNLLEAPDENIEKAAEVLKA